MAKGNPKGDATGRPRGKAVRWSAADLSRMSEVGPEDVASAKAEFKRLAPARVKRLLDRPKQ